MCLQPRESIGRQSIDHRPLEVQKSLQDLDSKVQRMIAMQVKPLRVGPGHHICSQGSPADSLWLLQEGKPLLLHMPLPSLFDGLAELVHALTLHAADAVAVAVQA